MSGSGDRAGAGRRLCDAVGNGEILREQGGGAERRIILTAEKAFRPPIKLRSYPCTRVVQRAALRRGVERVFPDASDASSDDKEFEQKVTWIVNSYILFKTASSEWTHLNNLLNSCEDMYK
jgi:hypothetical protein